jgi:hypothetical protein
VGHSTQFGGRRAAGRLKCTSRRNFAPFASSVIEHYTASARSSGADALSRRKCIPVQYWAMASFHSFRIPGMRK